MEFFHWTPQVNRSLACRVVSDIRLESSESKLNASVSFQPSEMNLTKKELIIFLKYYYHSFPP